MQPLEIDYTIYVATSRERLWEGLTTAEDTRQYWAEEIRSDWRIGSAVEAFALDGTLNWHGTLLEHEPPQVLSYTFGVPKADPPTTRYGSSSRTSTPVTSPRCRSCGYGSLTTGLTRTRRSSADTDEPGRSS